MGESERVEFAGSDGQVLAGLLDRPVGEFRGVVLFVHCFTCGKDGVAATQIAAELASRGLAVLRFDFTGVGHSEGEFHETGFGSNTDDIVFAADYLRASIGAPAVLIGHSLGGAAALAAAHRIPELAAVVTIGAPFDPAHVTHLLSGAQAQIEASGVAEVVLAGRKFLIGRRFFEEIAAQPQAARIADLGLPLLVLHSPLDQLVGVENAGLIFEAARHPKSFVALDGTDHLLSDAADARYAAGVIEAWVARYLRSVVSVDEAVEESGTVVVSSVPGGGFRHLITAGSHRLVADEPESVGGGDSGPNPYDLLLAALGSCTAMTMRMYADRKKLDLQGVRVSLRHKKIHAKDCEDCETVVGMLSHIERRIEITGDLDGAARERLLVIADKCPVHRTLTSEIVVETTLVE